MSPRPSPRSRIRKIGSVLHEPVLDKNIPHQLLGNQFKVHPTQSNQKSLEKAFGVLEQVHKLRQELNKIQLGPGDEPEVEQGKQIPELSPPEQALKEMAEAFDY